jgi:hypothetical protein
VVTEQYGPEVLEEHHTDNHRQEKVLLANCMVAVELEVVVVVVVPVVEVALLALLYLSGNKVSTKCGPNQSSSYGTECGWRYPRWLSDAI